MLIMNGTKVVARPYKVNGMTVGFRAEPNTTYMDTPLVLFGYSKREVTYAEFLRWVKTRCAPENRLDIEACLAEIGLSEYDPWEIVKRTGGVLTGVDKFWVDFTGFVENFEKTRAEIVKWL